MRVFRARHFSGIAFLCFSLAACGGGNALKMVSPVGTVQQHALVPQSTSSTASPSTYNVDLGGGYSGKFSLNSNQLTVKNSGVFNAGNCPEIPEIELDNNSANSFDVPLTSFSITVPCYITPGTPFEASFFVLQPASTIAGIKLATAFAPSTATATSTTLTFTPLAGLTTFTVPAKSISGIAALQESSNSTIAAAQVALPVVSHATTNLTSSQDPNVFGTPGSILPNGKLARSLQVSYAAASGNPLYQSACFPAFDSSGNLNPQLSTAITVGKPSFFCNLDPGSATTTFGGLTSNVTFTVALPPDASVLGLDGPPVNYACVTATQCDTPTFALNATTGTSNPTAYSNVIASNVKDLQLCIPLVTGTDCNTVLNDSTTSVLQQHGDFQVLVADDPTYLPTTQWSGLFTATITSGSCVFSTKKSDSSDLPTSPAYSDASPAPTNGTTTTIGTGPYAEFDITPKKADTCTISVSEDPKYIVSNVLTPNVGRTATLNVTIK